MADKKKGKMKKMGEEEKPSKEEYAVAKFLRFGLDTRDGKLHGMEVKCFMGNAAVDKLMDSKWSSTKNKKDPIFTSRTVCVAYMVRLLEKGLFHRAEKDKKKKDKDNVKKKKKIEKKEEAATNTDEGVRERKSKKDKKSLKEKESEKKEEESEKKEDDKEEKKKQEEKEKKKREKVIKLLMPDLQYFEDGNEVFVWIYDPVNAKNFIIGLLMVLGAIGLCMFPLWPDELRIGVYYLSLCAAGFVGFILSLVVIRLILFCCIWVLTIGHHHFWLLPNLTEDVGFFDSFKPLYHHEKVKAEESKPSEGKKKKKKKDDKETAGKKDKSSDKDEKEDSDEFEVIKKEDIEENEKDENALDDDEEQDETADDENDLDDENDDENIDSENEEEESKEPKKTK